jgi:hypothetical protein
LSVFSGSVERALTDVAGSIGLDDGSSAERWLDAQLEGRPVPPLLVVIGLGQGHVLDAIENRAPATRVLALEPEPAVAEAFRSRRDWSRWFESGRLMYLVDPDYAGADDAWRMFPDSPGAYTLLVHPTLAREGPPGAVRAAQVVKRIVFGVRANAGARRANAGRYLLNTLRNLSAIAEGGDVDALAGLFADRPAVVAAAGPSLTRNLDDLRAVRGRVVLIAVDTAARPLLTAGIAPDLVVGLDPTEANARHFVDLPEAPASFLIGEGSLGTSARAAFEGRSFTFKVSDHEPWPWLASLGLDRGRLRAWGSVVTSAFDLALRAGCPEIGFVGLDLAFTNRRPYCRDMTWEGDWAKLAAWGYSLDDVWERALEKWTTQTTVDMNGRDVITAPHLVAFRDWLVEQMNGSAAAVDGRRYINASGGGILAGRNIEQGTLAGAFARWPARDAVERTRRIADAHARGLGARPFQGHDQVVLQGRDQFPRWREFAFNTVSDAEIENALENRDPEGVARLGLRQGSVARPFQGRDSRLAAIRPAEVAAVIRALLGGGEVPAWVTRDGDWPSPTVDESASWMSRAQELLGDIASRDDLLRPDADVEQLRGALDVAFLGVPASALFPWTPDVQPLVHAFEAAIASAIDVTQPVAPGQFPDRRDEVRLEADATDRDVLATLARVACEWEVARATERIATLKGSRPKTL